MQNNYTNIQIGHGLAATKNKKKGKFPSLYKFRIIGSWLKKREQDYINEKPRRHSSL